MLDRVGETLHFAALEPNGLTELYALEDGRAVRLTEINGAFLADHSVARGGGTFPLVNSDGIAIDGWVLKPFGV